VLAQAANLGTPADVLAQIRDGAFNAFLDASQVTSAIAAGVVLVAAIVVVVALPHMRPPEDERTEVEVGSSPAPAES
jgi:hypothetical protein